MKTQLFDTKVSSTGNHKITFMITTDAVDRDGDSIHPEGWDLKSFKGNPVVLWAHDHTQPPIGRATSITVTPEGLRADVEFPPRGLYEFADMIHDMVKGGFLNATSVGFMPKESYPNMMGGQNITRAELLEFSIVSVPSNPQALVMQRSVNRSALMKWLGTSDDMIDWTAINRSSEPEINWTSINRSLSNKVEVNISTEDVELVVEALQPVFRAHMREELRRQVRSATEDAMNYMMGRLD